MQTSWKQAIQATAHCLTGCAIGEVTGMIVGTALGWSNISTIILSIILAFIFGYALTMRSVLKTGVKMGAAISIALAADTVSIAIMEVVDNLIMWVIPGAMDAGLNSFFFWSSLVFALAIAFVVALPVNRWLISRGKGHAVAHSAHEHHQHH